MTGADPSAFSQPSIEKSVLGFEQFAVAESPNLTTRVEGEICSLQLTATIDSVELTVEMREGNQRDEGRLFVGKGEGGDICDGKSVAGVIVGEEVAEPMRQISTSVIDHPAANILPFFSSL